VGEDSGAGAPDIRSLVVLHGTKLQSVKGRHCPRFSGITAARADPSRFKVRPRAHEL
jgi:hypothetical protein